MNAQFDATMDGITPACAGNTNRNSHYIHLPKDHPRLRGEYHGHNLGTRVLTGSPPLARGIQFGNHIRKLQTRITPACAGNTVPNILLTLSAEDHPRLRGEYFSLNATPDMILGSPPLARGIPEKGKPQTHITGITPACAGNTKKKQQ